MRAVWLRRTFFMAGSSSPCEQHQHPCSMQGSQSLWGGNRGTYESWKCRQEGERCTPNSFPLFICSASLNSKQEWPRQAGEPWWRVPQAQGNVKSTASWHLTHPSPPPTLKPWLLTFASRLNWRRDMVAAAVEVRRSRARTTEKEIIISRAGGSSPWFPIPGAWYDVYLPPG